MKRTKNKNLTIYLLKNNAKSFKTYLRKEYQNSKRVKRYYIDKQKLSGNIEKGLIFIYEECLPAPDWEKYLNEISVKQNIEISPKKTSKSIVFLTVKGQAKKTFALTFGHGSTLLDGECIVSDFGYIISKSLLKQDGLISIASTSIDRKMFNTKKQSSEYLIPEKLLEYGTQTIVNTVHGIHKEFNAKFSIGGNDSLSFRGNIDLLSDLEQWLTRFADLYSRAEDNLGIAEDLIPVDKTLKEILDNKLCEKILRIISENKITRNHTGLLRISPSVTFDVKNFNGFFVTGLGYKNPIFSSDFSIDEIDFFERFKRKSEDKSKEDILRKLKAAEIQRVMDGENTPIPVCSVYKALHFEISLPSSPQSQKYILLSGKWYKIDKEFYSVLEKEINAIPEPNTNGRIEFIGFKRDVHFKTVIKDGKEKKQASEGKYNEAFAKKNHILMLDRENYYLDNETVKLYNYKKNSPIEICDLIYFDKNKIQFIHVKRHSGASGTSHLLMQALVSAYAFNNDNKAVVNHINAEITDFNAKNTSYAFQELKYKDQKKEIILAIIDSKKKNKNSKLLSLLEMISLRANVKSLENLGYKCYLQFISAD